MALMIGLMDKKSRVVPEWKTPGRHATFSSIYDFFLWANSKFCLYPPNYTDFCYADLHNPTDGWHEIEASDSFDDVMSENKAILLSGHIPLVREGQVVVHREWFAIYCKDC